MIRVADAFVENTGVVMRMVGEHQRHNAVTAISAALALRRRGFLNLTVKTILGGLQAAQLPGRFQVLISHCKCPCTSYQLLFFCVVVDGRVFNAIVTGLIGPGIPFCGIMAVDGRDAAP